MHFIEQAQIRIAKKGIKAVDIKHKDLLTKEQICDIEHSQVYQWIKCGDWSQKDFEKWLRALRVIE